MHSLGTTPRYEPARLEHVAQCQVGAGVGLKMLCAQAANETLRHCRIGLVTPLDPTGKMPDNAKISE